MRKVYDYIRSKKFFFLGRKDHIFADIRSRIINSQLEGYNRIYGDAVISNSIIGRGTYIAFGTHVNKSSVGRFCSIGQNCRIGGLGRHPTNLFTSHPAFYSTSGQAGFSFVDEDLFDEYLPTSTGHNCWLGYGVVVIDGVTIGDNVIVASGAVVTQSIPQNSIVGGVPARVIRDREQEVIPETWWNLPIPQLKRLTHIAMNRNFRQYTEAFLRAVKNE